MTETWVHTSPSRRLGRMFDVALFTGGAAAATALVSDGVHDVGGGGGWPRWLELTYLLGLITAVICLILAGVARTRMSNIGAVLSDEHTRATHTRALGSALLAVLVVQIPFLVDVDTASVALAKFTVAAALLGYGVARLWFNR